MGSYLLNDRTAVEIRPIRADDGDRLRESHERLSEESRYRRFLGSKPHLSAADARYLVEVDGSDHFALVATLPDEQGSIIAVARYFRVPDDPRVAEFAIVVGDVYHRQGLATALLRSLAEVAIGHGIERFRATMLADNAAVHRLLERIGGAPLEPRRFGPISEVEIRLSPRRPSPRRPLPRRPLPRRPLPRRLLPRRSPGSAVTPELGASTAPAMIAAWPGS